MKVRIDNRQSRFKLPLKKVRKKVQVILDALGCPEGELSLVIVDDARIQELNRDYLKRNRPTNVMAFPMQEGLFSDINPHLLGDIVISVETALAEAQSAGIPHERRFDELLIHGILHLFGYDHEKDETEAHRMEEKSIALYGLIENR